MVEIPAKAKEIVESNRCCFCTIRDGNKPHPIALVHVRVVGSQLVLTDNYMKVTPVNLKSNPNCALLVFGQEEECYRIEGTGKYYSQGKWVDIVKNIKETDTEPRKGAILMNVESVTKLA
ncbi:pyridoxamine 5'-phosphate oxidase family protein [Candidatus Woesearchaeota archaeon]|nr:pyridoxamine 5'-phosphate oxidase family protein [Candidatus Woesearchaeota archaeon]